MIYYTETARQSAQENIDNCIKKIMQVPGDILDSLTVTKTVGHLYDLKKYIEKEDKDCKNKAYAAENAMREEEGLEPLNQLTVSNLLDDTYSNIRDIINMYSKDGNYDLASVLVVRAILNSVVTTIKEKKYAI